MIVVIFVIVVAIVVVRGWGEPVVFMLRCFVTWFDLEPSWRLRVLLRSNMPPPR